MSRPERIEATSVGAGGPASLPASVTLYWLPLGAGGHCIRLNGRLFEALQARHEHRPVRDLYHSALQVRLGAERFVIEMTPVLGGGTADRGVVREGPVASRLLRCSALFRYEVRRWRDGTIPDVAEAVAGPRIVSTDATRAREVLRLASLVPALVWGPRRKPYRRDVELQLTDRLAPRQQRPPDGNDRPTRPRPRSQMARRPGCSRPA